MSKINRPARIIAPLPGESDASWQTSRARRPDYAALLRRSRSPAQERDGHGHAGSADDAGAHAEGDQFQHDEHDPKQTEPIADRIGSVCAPIVDAVYRQQGGFIELTARIAREIAAFCANRAISRAGFWEVCLPLDPKVLPETTLYLTLSHECLQLRFDVQDASSRQLLLQHGRMLGRELTALLEAWGEPREVDIVIG